MRPCILLLLLLCTLASLTRGQRILNTAVNEVPYQFDTDCHLKVVVSGRAYDWNGDITFLANSQEMLMIGIHPERQNLAVRNDVFKRGSLQWTYRWVDVTYPTPKRGGQREYTFEFTSLRFVLKHGDTILLTIPYAELTYNKERFLKSINFVKFTISTERGPMSLQYAKQCPVKPGPPGEAGEPGEVGERGETGDKGEPGENDSCISSGITGSLVSSICTSIGPRGVAGSPGLAGNKGEAGEPGVDGEDGEDGEDGPPGNDGVPGESGEPGDDGSDGLDGSPGVDGEENCNAEKCVMKLGHCYAMSSITLSVQCRAGYAATSIWRNTEFWGLKCCEIKGHLTV